MSKQVGSPVLSCGESANQPALASLSRSSQPSTARCHVLLVSARNLGQPTGEWRLISERAAALRQYGVETDVLEVYPQRRLHPIVGAESWTSNILQIPYATPLAFPTALRQSLCQIRRWCALHPGSPVIISGLQLYPLVPILRSENTIIDLHGTLREWTELHNVTGFHRFLKFFYPIASLLELCALRNSRGALTVSEPLRRYAIASGAPRTWVIPCCVPASRASEFLPSDREISRRRLGLAPDETAVVYCGGVSAWQCLEESVDLFLQLRNRMPAARLVLFTPDCESARQIAVARKVPEPVVLSLPPQAVPSMLHACDIGLMLRAPTATNHFAFPNKFAEYVAAGLFIVSSSGLTDPARLLSRFGLGALVEPAQIHRGLTPMEIAEIVRMFEASGGQKARLLRSRPVVKDYLSMEARVAPFASDISPADDGTALNGDDCGCFC